MLQIKTIKNKLDNAADFDKAVNQALQEGWHLTRREVLQPLSQPNTSEHVVYTALYAELVKEELTEDEKVCTNCKHSGTHPHQEPCLSCNEDADKWEPADA